MKVLNNPGISIKTIPKEEQEEIKEEFFDNVDFSDHDDDNDDHVDDHDDQDDQDSPSEIIKEFKESKEEPEDQGSPKVTNSEFPVKAKPGFTCDMCDFTTRVRFFFHSKYSLT